MALTAEQRLTLLLDHFDEGALAWLLDEAEYGACLEADRALRALRTVERMKAEVTAASPQQLVFMPDPKAGLWLFGPADAPVPSRTRRKGLWYLHAALTLPGVWLGYPSTPSLRQAISRARETALQASPLLARALGRIETAGDARLRYLPEPGVEVATLRRQENPTP